jgi:hypothetical protein
VKGTRGGKEGTMVGSKEMVAGLVEEGMEEEKGKSNR